MTTHFEFCLKSFLLGLCLILNTFTQAQSSGGITDKYNVIWTTQSKNSSESMPLGGHSIGCNVWVEKGDLLMYAAQSGAFDENNEMLKMGRFRIHFSPNPFDSTGTFKQELKLQQGYIEITGKNTQAGAVMVRLWVETNRPVIHIDSKSDQPLNTTVSYETWREKNVLLKAEKLAITAGRRASIFDFDCYLVDIVKYADKFEQVNNRLYFYHNNDTISNAFDFVVKQQELTEIKDKLYDPLKKLISGGMLTGDNLRFKGTSDGKYYQTPFHAWTFETIKPAVTGSVTIYTNVEQASFKQWKQSIDKNTTVKTTTAQLFDNNIKWWNDFWNRSYIDINPSKNESDKAWTYGRNYNLFRYQLGGNTYGAMPTRFNGGTLTFDPGYVTDKYSFDPDFRRWGNSFTGQNQRLIYWPMLKTGDFEAMLPEFEFYRRALPNATQRTKVYWGHDGCSFTEQMQETGFPIASHYGFIENGYTLTVRPKDYEKGEQVNNFVGTMYQSQLEFAYMVIQYYNYSRRSIADYLPFVNECIRFYDKHYQYENQKKTGKKLNESGKLVFYPTTAQENNRNSTNAADVVSGVLGILKGALALPANVLPKEYRTYFEQVLKRCPDLPTEKIKIDGKDMTVLKESVFDESWRTGPIPSLYSVFPFDLIHVGMPEFQYALDTWKYKIPKTNKDQYQSWRPSAFMTARLGLTTEATALVSRKLGNSQRRYPTFWGPGHDWAPDHNWGGSGMIALQEMLMQCYGNTIHLFPSWPKDWDVDFKLVAPGNTVIEGQRLNGKLTLKVTPESRRKDIIIH
ncbi:MAG: DUF5703 domain-containing protein [Bacteroidota bacterium]|nr:DUF5703 domain-containing protein [Bacteroidota bacterium]